ncbi:related to meiotic recombination protein SPO11 [Ustilago trichophora]|uniref:DNA topoisomerase (ATP-hydrolyzing) n=1 Tax=Ustilago trichophora TaxID=86804 RepID=A0A5C3ECP9_9BASI|nr:related to meiotic recombination protein SPO11 [Ustilago trichophora]
MSTTDEHRRAILSRIDNLLLALLRQLAAQSALLDPTPTAPSSSTTESTEGNHRPAKRKKKESRPKITPLSLRVDREGQASGGGICFPTKSLMGVRRDVYYQSLHLFTSQQASDRTIERIVALLGCTDKVQLGIVASPRGLLSGSVSIVSPSSSRTLMRCERGVSTLIPTEITTSTTTGQEGWTVVLDCDTSSCPGHLVLVVEKEAVFKHLLHHQAAPDPSRSKIDWGKVVLITGKGYPDHATRALVQLLSRSNCSQGGKVYVEGLFDGDPWGVDVHRNYTFACPEISWLGVDVEDFLPSAADEELTSGCYPLVPLRNDERGKAVRLLRTLKDKDGERERRWRDMLTRMLLLGYKVEIEAAYDFVASDGNAGGLVGYLQLKLFSYIT